MSNALESKLSKIEEETPQTDVSSIMDLVREIVEKEKHLIWEMIQTQNYSSFQNAFIMALKDVVTEKVSQYQPLFALEYLHKTYAKESTLYTSLESYKEIGLLIGLINDKLKAKK